MLNSPQFSGAGPAVNDTSAGLSIRVERAVSSALASAVSAGGPPRLSKALHYAVFPGGARLRPQLCVLTSMACGDAHPAIADSAAAALELVHCASLVHDDLPCFDDANTRRGKPSVHKAFGEATALLVGDALIVLAFDVLARVIVSAPREVSQLVGILARAAGAPGGIVAGQAWETEPMALLDEVHRAKTASLFEAAAMMGALTSNAPPEPWGLFGEALGRAYQAADDLADANAGGTGARELGKPRGRDAALGRPRAVRSEGVDGARRKLVSLMDAAVDLVPPSPHGDRLVRAWVEGFASRVGYVCPRASAPSWAPQEARERA
jgi:geranylgeranyl diphosphate synthase type II